MKVFIFFITALLIQKISFAKNKKEIKINPYGKISVMGFIKESDLSLEDAGSRIGFIAKHKIKELKVNAYIRGEWSFNAIDNSSDLSIGANNNFVSDSSTKTFNRRLGFIGFKSKSFGDLRIGKQWSAYSDVSHFTDVFNLFGGSASGTYNLNTDGGQSGTGRVSKGIIYRNSILGFDYGLQAKFIQNKQLTIDGEETQLVAKDSFGVSLRKRFFKFLELGFAYNQIDMEGDEGAVSGYNGKNSWSAVLGLKLKFDQWKMAITTNQSENHELDSNNEIIDGQGYEAYIRYLPSLNTSFYFGYNFLEASDEDYNTDFKTDDTILGFDHKISNLKFYIETKVNNSQDHTGKSSENAHGLGMVYNLSY